MTRTIRLTDAMPDDWVAKQKGSYLDERHYNTLVTGESVDVVVPDGRPLLLFRRRALQRSVCERALRGLRRMNHRANDHREHLVSNAVGYYNCRQTPFTRQRLWEWGQCQPFIRACDQVFAQALPARHRAQLAVAQRTRWDLVIGSTAFTTVTVNLWDATHDARTRVHTDKGDLPEGFGVISVFSTGNYSGGYLCFPKWRVAVDMRTTDVLLCDVHEHHGNTDIKGQPGWERIACILYYRTAMQHCGKATED